MEAASRHILTRFETTRQLLERFGYAVGGDAGRDRENASGKRGLAWDQLIEMEQTGCAPSRRRHMVGSTIDRIKDLKIELSTIQTRFALATGHLYVKSTTGETGRNEARDEFSRIVTGENFLADIEGVVRRTERLVRKEHSKRKHAKLNFAQKQTKKNSVDQDLQAMLDSLERLIGSASDYTLKKLNTVPYKECLECDTEMAVDTATAGLCCPGCGYIRELVGTIFDESQFFCQEGQKAKSGIFNPNRHYRFWIDHILARNSEQDLNLTERSQKISETGNAKIVLDDLLQQLTSIVRRDQKKIRLLGVEDIRSMLKEVGRTDLNNSVSLILRKMTGVGPPLLSDELLLKGEKLFTEAIKIREHVCHAGRVNRNYYPFYIYKIFDGIIPEVDEENRRILYYIHLQGDETLSNNDAEWQRICEELPEIEWRPTNRSLANKYRPI